MSLKKKGAVLIGSLLVVGMLATGCNSKEASAPNAEQSIVVHGDTINSHLVESAICVQNSRFEQGQRLVFRASVNDAATGKLIEDAKVKVVLGNGEEYEMVLGNHGEEQTPLYSYGYTIPEDAPTGTLDYKYVAEVNGKTAVYEPFNVSLSKLTIVEKSGN